MTWQPTLEDSPTCDSATDLTFLSHGLRGPALLPSARACQTVLRQSLQEVQTIQSCATRSIEHYNIPKTNLPMDEQQLEPFEDVLSN